MFAFVSNVKLRVSPFITLQARHLQDHSMNGLPVLGDWSTPLSENLYRSYCLPWPTLQFQLLRECKISPQSYNLYLRNPLYRYMSGLYIYIYNTCSCACICTYTSQFTAAPSTGPTSAAFRAADQWHARRDGLWVQVSGARHHVNNSNSFQHVLSKSNTCL